MRTHAQRLDVADRRKIAKLMVLANLTGRKLAEKAGQKSHTWVYGVLRGEITTVTPAFAAAIAEALEVDVADLFVPTVSMNRAQDVETDAA